VIRFTISARRHEQAIDHAILGRRRQHAEADAADDPENGGTEDQRKGNRCRLDHFRYHLLAAVDERGQVVGDEQPLHHQRVLNRQRAFEPEVVANGGEHLGRGIASGDARGRVGSGRGEEDQEDQDADACHDEDHLGEAADEETGHAISGTAAWSADRARREPHRPAG
jgi:hypothetical protein